MSLFTRFLYDGIVSDSLVIPSLIIISVVSNPSWRSSLLVFDLYECKVSDTSVWDGRLRYLCIEYGQAVLPARWYLLLKLQLVQIPDQEQSDQVFALLFVQHAKQSEYLEKCRTR